MKYIQDRTTGEIVLAASPQKTRSHFVMGDLPDYTSPVDDRVVHGRKGRREDLKRSGCRPYEGRASETKEAERQKGYIEKAQDHRIEAAARHAYAQLSPDKKRILLRG